MGVDCMSWCWGSQSVGQGSPVWLLSAATLAGQLVSKGQSFQVGKGLGPLWWGNWKNRDIVEGSLRWAPARVEQLRVDKCSPEVSSVGTRLGPCKWGIQGWKGYRKVEFT